VTNTEVEFLEFSQSAVTRKSRKAQRDGRPLGG